MKISERQGQILNTVVREYINSAQPVSSQLVEKKHNFGICPATIRIEMQNLTEKDYLFQPHTSAGRIPTDKGYRFFVDRLLERGFSGEDFDFDFEAEDLLGGEINDTVKFIQAITKNLANLSSGLVLSYLFDEKIIWKEGWEDLLGEPEFREAKFISEFTELIRNFEEGIEKVKTDSAIQIYIGKENPFPKVRDFSTIISRCHFPGREEGIVAILGPKRMAYEKNIGLMTSLIELLEKY